ncbi:hypothetical protein Hdeb2414_s0012g00377031 [Helianthus debilis subsp. tardiflorus]
MPTSTYPKEWKKKFIFVSAAMLSESPILTDPKASIDDSVPVLSENDTVLWKRMHENPTMAYNFPEGVLGMGGLSPLYSVRPKAYSGKKEKGEETPAHDEGSSKEAEKSQGSLRVKGSSGDEDEDFKSLLARKQKVDPTVSLKIVIHEPRNIRQRLKSASGQKPFPATKVTSEVLPTGAKGSLSKHLKSSSLVREKAPIMIHVAPASFWIKDKALEISVARITPAFDVSPLRATGTSKPMQPEDPFPRSPLAPLFAAALPVPYVPKGKITPSTIVGTPETGRDFMNHVTDAERKLLEEKGESLGEGGMAWLEEKEELIAELKHHKEAASVSGTDVETLYTDWVIAMEDKQKLAQERHWLISQGFGLFVFVASKSEEFKGSLERIYKAYRDVGY